MPFDYCGNLTTAHPVVKVCAADSQAITSLYDWSCLLGPVAGGALFSLSPFGKRLYVNPGFGGRRVVPGVTVPWDPRTSCALKMSC